MSNGGGQCISLGTGHLILFSQRQEVSNLTIKRSKLISHLKARAGLVGKLIMPMGGGTGKPLLQAFDKVPEEVFLYLGPGVYGLIV